MRIGEVMYAMISYFAGDARRVNHFLKVYGFAKTIGEAEGLDTRAREILEIAALTHDIGIRNSEQKFGSCSGEHQQIEGPPEAEKLLSELGVTREVVERVCWLIAYHHTYTNVTGIDYQILIEADFLVNAYEDGMSREAITSVREKLFRTKTGIELLDSLYLRGIDAR